MWKRFDKVVLLTTKNIKWLSAPAGKPDNPKGYWIIVGNIPGTGEVILAKNKTMVKVPISDISKRFDYDIDKFMKRVSEVKSYKHLGENKNGQKE